MVSEMTLGNMEEHPLEPSCDAGSTQDRQSPEDDRQNRGVGGIRSNPGGARVSGDREVEDRQDRQCVGNGGHVGGDGPDQTQGTPPSDRPHDGTGPRCAGEGCRWCGGMGRLVDDQPEETRP
jgi:hypothetical protein